MAGEPFGFAAFRSRQQAAAFESALKKQGINCKIINTPHQIGMGCGLSVKYTLGDFNAVTLVSEKMHQSALIGYYSAEYTNGKLQYKPVAKVMRCN